VVPVSAIVVSYNTRELLRACLLSLEDVEEVIVVDNNSQDGSADMVLSDFPKTVLIRNTDNRGFGAANNQGLRVATQPYALLINSDAAAHAGAVSALAASLDDPGRVAAGGKLVYPDGRFQLSASNRLTLWVVFCEQFGLESIFRPYWIRSAESQDVAQVMGACLMMKRADGAFLEFDENIFLYCEDTELCERLRRQGSIRYETGAVFTHALGASSLENRWRSVSLYNKGKEYYFRKTSGPIAAGLCWLMDRLGALLRLVIWGIVAVLTLGKLKQSGARVGLWWRVLTAH